MEKETSNKTEDIAANRNRCDSYYPKSLQGQ